MKEIKCPHCSKAFKIDESGYAAIVKQIRDEEFDQQLKDRLEIAEREKESAVQLAVGKLEGELEKSNATKDLEIQNLKSKIESSAIETKLAVTEAVKEVEKERDELKSGLERAAIERDLATKSLEDKYTTQIKDRDDAI